MSKQDQKSEIDRIRIEKHNKLIKLIETYSVTDKQKQKIQDMKKETQFQISMRYARSKVNYNYKFIQNYSDDDQGDQPEELRNPINLTFNLHTQQVILLESKRKSTMKTSEQDNSFPQPKSVSLKKISPKTDVILKRTQHIKYNNDFKMKLQDIKVLTKAKLFQTSRKNHSRLPSLQSFQNMKQKIFKSQKSSPTKLKTTRHYRLVTQQVKKSISKAKYKLKTEQSTNKHPSIAKLNSSKNNTILKTEMILLGINQTDHKKTLLGKMLF